MAKYTSDLLEMADQFKRLGYKVYSKLFRCCREEKHLVTYAYAVRDDGTFIYFQTDRIDGFTMSTVCIPSRNTGSGHRIDKRILGMDIWDSEGNLSAEAVSKAMAIAATAQFGMPYRNFDAYRKQEEDRWKVVFEEI